MKKNYYPVTEACKRICNSCGGEGKTIRGLCTVCFRNSPEMKERERKRKREYEKRPEVRERRNKQSRERRKNDPEWAEKKRRQRRDWRARIREQKGEAEL